MYREWLPPQSLQPTVQAVWINALGADGADPPPLRVMPDGCLDLIWDVANPERGFWVGAMTRSVLVPAFPARTLLGVRFQPGGSQPLLGGAIPALTDHSVECRDLDFDDSAFVRCLRLAKRPEDAIPGLFSLLGQRLAPAWTDPLVSRFVARTRNAKGVIRVTEAAQDLGVTRQTLRRRCLAATGLDPKVLCRALRLRALLAEAKAAQSPAWAALAAEFGYADQAHLTRDFKALVGVTPGAYLP